MKQRSLERRAFLASSASLAAAGIAGGGVAAGAAAESQTTIDLAVFPKKRISERDVLPPEKTALIIVDMINRFCDPQRMSGGSAEGAKMIAASLATIVPNIRQVLEAFRRAGGLVGSMWARLASSDEIARGLVTK